MANVEVMVFVGGLPKEIVSFKRTAEYKLAKRIKKNTLTDDVIQNDIKSENPEVITMKAEVPTAEVPIPETNQKQSAQSKYRCPIPGCKNKNPVLLYQHLYKIHGLRGVVLKLWLEQGSGNTAYKYDSTSDNNSFQLEQSRDVVR